MLTAFYSFLKLFTAFYSFSQLCKAFYSCLQDYSVLLKGLIRHFYVDLQTLRRWNAPASISITNNLFLKKKVQEEVICQNRSQARFRDRSEARLMDRSVARLRDRSEVKASEASKWLGRSPPHTSVKAPSRPQALTEV